jgi:hypothetical protein
MRSLVPARTGLLASFASAALIALAVLAPTGAGAAPNSLTAETSDAYMKGSCDFAVTRNNNFDSVTAKLTMKTLEVKPSIFSPRRVASATINCMVTLNDDPEGAPNVYAKINPNGATIYKSQYITLGWSSGYTVCIELSYTLRTGAHGNAPMNCVSSN